MSLPDEITRIRRYQEEPEKAPPSEACTRLWVIDPLLRRMGYDHDEILPEAPDPTGRYPDYTILPGTPQTWYLEAKAWNVALKGEHVIQAMNYAHAKGHRWVVLTNGHEWRLYDDHIQGVEAGQRLVASAHLEDGGSFEGFLKALRKEAFQGGDTAKFAARSRLASVLQDHLARPDSKIIRAIATALKTRLNIAGITNAEIVECLQEGLVPAPGSAQPVTPAPLASRDSARNLDELKQMGEALHSRHPAFVLYPDGQEEGVASWREVAYGVLVWLGRQHPLPVPFSIKQDAKWWFLNTSPTHQDGTAMRGKYRILDTGGRQVYVDVHRSAPNIVRQMHRICEVLGVPPTGFAVRLRS